MRPFNVVCIDHKSGLETGTVYTVTDCLLINGDTEYYIINGGKYWSDYFRPFEI